MSNPYLTFDIDLEELEAIGSQLTATEHQLKAAYGRALSRTQVTMQARSRKLLADGMGAKSAKRVQRRMQTFKLRRGKKNQLADLKLWFGLNDVGPHNLKGRMSAKRDSGATFSSTKVGTHKFDRGFMFSREGKKYLYERFGKEEKKIRSVKIAVAKGLQERIEDESFDDLPEVFMAHFETDLKSRVKMGMHKDGWFNRGSGD